MTTLINSTNQLVTTVGLDQLLPKIVAAIDKAEDEGRNLVDHSFRQAVLIILVWMLAYSVARIIVHYVTKRRVRAAAGG